MRSLDRYLRRIPEAHRYLGWFVRCVRIFSRPWQFLGHYLRQTSPADGVVLFRDGSHIHLSGHPHDVITLFVIFVREDYGRFPPGATVVDIGANLGAFALFAARQGAKKVFAYEPNGPAHRLLVQNVGDNRLEATIQPRRLAVSGQAGQSVRFPVAPSAYNRIAAEGEAGEFDTVQTTSLAEILARDAPEGIDLLKVDCEGAEYDILLGAERELARVREIRMEYHGGRQQELVDLFRRCGFEITRLEADSGLTGNLWARRAGTGA